MNDDIKAVIFDMDGVLVDSMKYHARSFDRALKEIGVDLEEEDVYRLEGKGSKLVIKGLLEEEGMEVSEEILDEIVDRKREIFDKIEKIEIFPEIKQILKELEGRFKLGLVTGSNRKTVESLLDKYFEGIFDVVVTEEDTEEKKPDPAPYEKGLEKLGGEKDKVLVIENAPLGVESAKNAGMECWAVAAYLETEELEEAGADKVFEDHEKLAEFMEEKLVH